MTDCAFSFSVVSKSELRLRDIWIGSNPDLSSGRDVKTIRFMIPGLKPTKKNNNQHKERKKMCLSERRCWEGGGENWLFTTTDPVRDLECPWWALFPFSLSNHLIPSFPGWHPKKLRPSFPSNLLPLSAGTLTDCHILATLPVESCERQEGR